MKSAIAQGMGGEVRRLLEVVQQQQPRLHRDSVDREDSLFTSYKCPLTDDLLYEPVRPSFCFWVWVCVSCLVTVALLICLSAPSCPKVGT